MRQEPNASRVGSLRVQRRIRLGGSVGRPDPARRPHPLAVDGHGVLAARPRLEAVDDHEGVVVSVGAEGRRRPRPAERPHRHAARVAGLDPHRRSGLADVAQQWSQNEGSGSSGTRQFYTASPCRGAPTPKGGSPLGEPPSGVCRVAGLEASLRSPCRPSRRRRRHAGAAFSGLSAMTASVVRNSAAIDAAFCSAERVTLAGSMMPAAMQVDVLAGRGVQAVTRRQVARPSPPRRRPRGRR